MAPRTNRKTSSFVLLGVFVALFFVPLSIMAQEEVTTLDMPEGYVEIPAGSFMMGSPVNEEGRARSEGPQRRVTITRSFALKATPITQGEWREVMGANPSNFSSCGDNCPVEMVTWYDAVTYLNRLSEREGLEVCYEMSGCSGTLGGGCTFERYCPDTYTCSTVEFRGLDCEGYRLPTEAEWEYAARAETTGARYGNLDQIAWHRGNSRWQTQPVGQKQPNEWGLYDMIGNVWEWTNDWYGDYQPGSVTDPEGPSTGSTQVARGCSFSSRSSESRTANRLQNLAIALTRADIGFRSARSIPSRIDNEPGELELPQNVPQEASPALLLVQANVQNAEILVDGNVVGQTVRGRVVEVVTAATAQKLSLRLDGYLTEIRDLNLSPGARQDVNVEMEIKIDSPLPEGYVEIPPGTFTQRINNRHRPEVNGAREVTISRAFALKATPITLTEWQDVMGESSSATCADCPKLWRTWSNAASYLNRLSEREGLETCYEENDTSFLFKGLDCEGYRFPTQAEWFYAAQAGTDSPIYGELNDIAQFSSSGRPRAPVGGKRANLWGLYDLLGNVFEWTNDWSRQHRLENVTDPSGASTGGPSDFRRLVGCSRLSSSAVCLYTSTEILENLALPRGAGNGLRPARSIPTPSLTPDEVQEIFALDQACRDGNMEKCLELGLRYYRGDGLTRDHALAAEWFKHGCDNDAFDGCVYLGMLYGIGSGVEQHYGRAASLYEQACDGGAAEGCDQLALYYRVSGDETDRVYRGVEEYIPHDLARSISLYERACNLDHFDACSTLGYFYLRGKGVPQDNDRAIFFFEKSCEGGGDGCGFLRLYADQLGR